MQGAPAARRTHRGLRTCGRRRDVTAAWSSAPGTRLKFQSTAAPPSRADSYGRGLGSPWSAPRAGAGCRRPADGAAPPADSVSSEPENAAGLNADAVSAVYTGLRGHTGPVETCFALTPLGRRHLGPTGLEKSWRKRPLDAHRTCCFSRFFTRLLENSDFLPGRQHSHRTALLQSLRRRAGRPRWPSSVALLGDGQRRTGASCGPAARARPLVLSGRPVCPPRVLTC